MLATGVPSASVLSHTHVLTMSMLVVNRCANLFMEMLYFMKPCHRQPDGASGFFLTFASMRRFVWRRLHKCAT